MSETRQVQLWAVTVQDRSSSHALQVTIHITDNVELFRRREPNIVSVVPLARKMQHHNDNTNWRHHK